MDMSAPEKERAESTNADDSEEGPGPGTGPGGAGARTVGGAVSVEGADPGESRGKDKSVELKESGEEGREELDRSPGRKFK
jgi:hypothetical protein